MVKKQLESGKLLVATGELEGEELLFQKWFQAALCKYLDQTRRCLDQKRLAQREALKLCMHTTIKLTSYMVSHQTANRNW